MKRLFLFLFLCLVPTLLVAQTSEWSLLHRGNRAYRRGDYKEAENLYRRALETHPRSTRAAFNLGDAYLSQKNEKGALEQFENAAKGETNKKIKAMAFHNIGYIHHINKDYDKAIEAYKEALRNNPKDEATRYNLVLCQKMRQEKQKQKQQEQKNDSDGGKKKQEDDKNKDRQPNDEQKMSENNAEQLLNLARQAEQQTRRKLQHARQPRRRQLDKNW